MRLKIPIIEIETSPVKNIKMKFKDNLVIDVPGVEETVATKSKLESISQQNILVKKWLVPPKQNGGHQEGLKLTVLKLRLLQIQPK